MTDRFLDDDIDFATHLRETDANWVGMGTSESAVVSILLNFPNAHDACEQLRPEFFVDDQLRMVFAEICKQHAKGTYDLLTIHEALKDRIELAELDEISKFNDHGMRAIDRHVQRLIDAYKSRKLYDVSVLVQGLAFEDTPIQGRIDKAAAALMALEDKSDLGDWVDAHAGAIKHMELIEARERGEVSGMATGLPSFDRELDGGLARGALVVIGARPAMGKTALGLTIGLWMAQDWSVGFLSMEMPHADVRDRQTAILGNVSISTIKQPQKGLEYSRIVDAIENAKFRKFYVSDKGGLNILQVRSKARALKRAKGLDVLIVDYIGLMAGLDLRQPRAYQVEEISKGLKMLAKELDIVVICLAQVNRGAAERGNHCPALHDLRDSGAIEQDADVVAFIHRPILANPEIGDQWSNYALLRIAKNRQGRTGDVHLHYVADQTRFGSWTGEIPSKGAGKAREQFE